jgi:heme/copper-type cytochrome/quinol oxidase subunit 2
MRETGTGQQVAQLLDCYMMMVVVMVMVMVMMMMMMMKVLVEKSEGKRPLGVPRYRRENEIRMDVREIGQKGVD